MISATIFSYPPDYLSTAYAARALRRCGVRVVVAIDRADPELVLDGCEVIRTSFPRRGNLNGKACVEGILATLEANARPEDQWALKVDADALPLRMGWLEGRSEEMVGMCHPGKHLHYGFCYAIRRDALPALRERARGLEDDPWCPEDCTIGGLAKSWHRYENLTEGCPMAAYPWKSDKPPAWWRDAYEVLVFQRLDGRGRREVAEMMREFLR